SYAGATEGGLSQGGITQTFGHRWDSGNALASIDVWSATALENSDRSFSAGAGPGFLTPIDQRYNALVTFNQDLDDRVSMNGDFLYSNRDFKNNATIPGTSPQNVTQRGDTEQYFGNAGLDVALTDSLNGSLLATYSNIDIDNMQTVFRPTTGARTS